MKKVVTIVSVIFCAVILFFSFMGEKLYYSTKPRVEIERPIRVNDKVILPETAVFHEADGDYIFTVEGEQGFSAEILTVTKIRLTSCQPDDMGYFGEGYVLVEAEEYHNAPTVVWSSENLRDGQRVTESEEQ